MQSFGVHVSAIGVITTPVFISMLRDAGCDSKIKAFSKYLLTIHPRCESVANMAEVLCALVAGQVSQALFVQIIWKLGWRIEKLLEDTLQRGGGSLLRAETVDLLSILWDNRRLDVEVVKQLFANTARGASLTNFTFAADEAHVGGGARCLILWWLPRTIPPCR